jgi:hypothetical protein
MDGKWDFMRISCHGIWWGFHGEKKWNRNISPTIKWDIWLVSSIDWLGNQFKMDISIGKSLSSMKDFPASHVWLAEGTGNIWVCDNLYRWFWCELNVYQWKLYFHNLAGS